MSEGNPNARLEAFCDGVFAIALTLLIIEIKPPLPSSVGSTSDLWHELEHRIPLFAAFVLSFGVILISWVNHHATLKLVHKSCASFIYANGFLLLTVVVVPFPTALLGEFLTSGYATPAVALYNAVIALQSVGWVLLTSAALNNGLTKDAPSTATMRESRRNGIFAFFLYSLLAVAAFWFPIAVVIITTITWVFWLVLGIRIRHIFQ
jgi:uncharacterized membrane protein